MSGAHTRARKLIAGARVEGISAADREWLDRHLLACPDCMSVCEESDRAIRSLRAVPVPVPPELAARTRMRVYLRLQEKHERRRGAWAMWAVCGVSWAAGIASSPYIWRGFEWVGHQAGLPPLVWKMGVVMWWAAPALLAAAGFWIEKSNWERYRMR